ncbi:MAG: PAS domain-containing protein [Candidatus Pacebacteria bacterium]|nr:PAS domain-containing protein [Candidatus Paceibacterota bacterium]
MKAKKTQTSKSSEIEPIDLVGRFWDESWTYIKTVVDVVREPVLILDKDLRVLAANEPFYRTFQVEAKDTEKKVVYELGNGQWDIPDLRRLLEEILPKNTFFKGFEVIHKFPLIGRKVMILNARQMHLKEELKMKPLILLAIEDITDMMDVADMLNVHTNKFKDAMTDRTEKLEKQIKKLEKEILVDKKVIKKKKKVIKKNKKEEKK